MATGSSEVVAGPVVVLSRRERIRQAVCARAEVSATLVTETLAALERAVAKQPPFVVFDTTAVGLGEFEAAAALLRDVHGRLAFVTAGSPDETRLLAAIARHRVDVEMALDEDAHFAMMLASVFDGRSVTGPTAQIVAAVQRELPQWVANFRIASALNARHEPSLQESCRLARCSESCVRKHIRDNGFPRLNSQMRWHAALYVTHDILVRRLVEKQVAALRGYGSASGVSHLVSDCTGAPIHEWKFRGGFTAMLAGYGTLWRAQDQFDHR